MPRNQSKAGMGIAYGQRKREQDGEKSVQSWHRTVYRQRKVSEDAEKSVQSRHRTAYGRENRQKEPESQSKTDIRATKWPTKTTR